MKPETFPQQPLTSNLREFKPQEGSVTFDVLPRPLWYRDNMNYNDNLAANGLGRLAHSTPYGEPQTLDEGICKLRCVSHWQFDDGLMRYSMLGKLFTFTLTPLLSMLGK